MSIAFSPYTSLFHRNKAVPQPFTSIPSPDEVQYLSDIRVYDTQSLAWHGVRAQGKGVGNSNGGSDEEPVLQPEGRYGMCFVVVLFGIDCLLCNREKGNYCSVCSKNCIF